MPEIHFGGFIIFNVVQKPQQKKNPGCFRITGLLSKNLTFSTTRKINN